MTKQIKHKKKSGPKQCEGFRRYRGAFSLGPVQWQQCSEIATVILTLKQDGQKQELPACAECWEEACRTPSIKVISAKPIPKKKQGGSRGKKD